MSEPIGPGDWVECVDTRGHHAVALGRAYLVEEIASNDGVSILALKGVRNELGWRWVYAECFRPIYRPKASLIQSLLKPIEADPAKEAAQ